MLVDDNQDVNTMKEEKKHTANFAFAPSLSPDSNNLLCSSCNAFALPVSAAASFFMSIAFCNCATSSSRVGKTPSNDKTALSNETLPSVTVSPVNAGAIGMGWEDNEK